MYSCNKVNCYYKQKVGEDLGVCVLNLQILLEKSKSQTRPRDKRDITSWKGSPCCM